VGVRLGGIRGEVSQHALALGCGRYGLAWVKAPLLPVDNSMINVKLVCHVYFGPRLSFNGHRRGHVDCETSELIGSRCLPVPFGKVAGVFTSGCRTAASSGTSMQLTPLVIWCVRCNIRSRGGSSACAHSPARTSPWAMDNVTRGCP
jgi:hypothetical protein